MNHTEYVVTGKSYSLTLSRFQGYINLGLQERVPRGVKCSEVLTVKNAKRLVKYLEAVIAEVEDSDGTENQ